MTENKSVDLGANPEQNRSKKKEYRKIRVNLYLTEKELADYAEEACKVGLRPRQAKILTLKPHGFAGQFEPNTQGIAKFIRKFCFPNWKQTEAERLVEKRELEKKAERLGLKIESS